MITNCKMKANLVPSMEVTFEHGSKPCRNP